MFREHLDHQPGAIFQHVHYHTLHRPFVVSFHIRMRGQFMMVNFRRSWSSDKSIAGMRQVDCRGIRRIDINVASCLGATTRCKAGIPLVGWRMREGGGRLQTERVTLVMTSAVLDICDAVTLATIMALRG